MKKYVKKFKEEKLDESFRPNFKSVYDFVNYLSRTLIPDLKKSSMEATAQDFQEAIFWITKAMNGKL